jgi:tetratricopeptide (TPR) repeat protein
VNSIKVRWANCLLTITILLAFTSFEATSGLASYSVYQLAQASTFRQYMNQGYTQVSQRNYRRALQFFQQALAVSPSSGSAARAIANMQTYIKRGARSRISFAVGRPGRVRSAATRGTCFQNQKPPIPLVPLDEEAQRTTAEYPTFYIYIPQITPEARKMEFVLRDDVNITPLYRESFQPVQQAGIITVRLPANRPLQTGKVYTWGFSIICDTRKRDEDLYVEGRIERTQDENLAVQLQTTSRILDRAVLYTTAGLWEDAITTVATLRRQRPNDPEVNQYWQDLLESIAPPEVVNKPFLPCCTP